MAKKDDKKNAAKQPAKTEPARAAPSAPKVAAPTDDAKRTVATVLDVEIANLKAELATLEKQGGDEDAIERVRDRLRLRAIQRVTL